MDVNFNNIINPSVGTVMCGDDDNYDDVYFLEIVKKFTGYVHFRITIPSYTISELVYKLLLHPNEGSAVFHVDTDYELKFIRINGYLKLAMEITDCNSSETIRLTWDTNLIESVINNMMDVSKKRIPHILHHVVKIY
mgnify:CR=1 FL=1